MRASLLAIALLFAGANVYAQALSEVAFISRCYAHLSGQPIPVSHPLRLQVKAGKLTGLQACEQLLDKVQLASDGYLTQRTDSDARAILRNFNSFHRSWFPANVVEQIQEYDEEVALGTRDIYDSTEPALAITRSVFAINARYSETLTLPTGLHALREEDPLVKSKMGWAVNFPGRGLHGNNSGRNQNLFNFRAMTGNFDGNGDTTNSMFAVIPKVEVGELVGIRSKTESFIIPNVSLRPLGGDKRGNDQPGLNYSFDLYKNLGGGVLGTPIYVMLNFGHGRGVDANGTTKVARRWSQTNMNTFLCANLPALRESDIRTYVVGNSSTPFRNSSSCVMCHATLDPMAYTARNVVVGATDYFRITSGANSHAKTALVLATYREEMPSVAGWPSEPVANFHRQTAEGRLFFRSMTGVLVDKPLRGIASLGQAMVETDDFYTCAAKRYFEYFTGIEVPLYDREDPNNEKLNRSLSSESIADRAFVESLGKDLRKTQSVKGLIKSIMGSEYYRSKKYRP